MPELPEVETTRRGILPWLQARRVVAVALHHTTLRWPISSELSTLVPLQVEDIQRRAKYLIWQTDRGYLLAHLGMSGSLRIVDDGAPRRKHDHIEWWLDDGSCLRYHDPRRFGAVLWLGDQPQHPLLAKLGPEPLESEFDGPWLFRLSRGRRQSVKAFLMDQAAVVGVGNIYATEALFAASIRPGRAAGRLTRQDCHNLVETIRTLLNAAIAQGGTTLKDFVNGSGEPGYFAQQLAVYGRSGLPCVRCAQAIKSVRLGQRNSFYCPACQPR